jgi:hypothetical protein
VAFVLQKDDKTDHLRNKENFRTIKPQGPLKLAIDNGLRE